jgi:hypothetical protein
MLSYEPTEDFVSVALAVSGFLRHGVDTRAPFVSRDHTERTSLRTLYTHLTMNHLYVSVFLFSVFPKEIVRNLETTYLPIYLPPR